MLFVFPPIIVVDTKIIFGYKFVAPLRTTMFFDKLSLPAVSGNGKLKDHELFFFFYIKEILSNMR